MWIYLTRRVEQFMAELTITDNQLQDGLTKQAGVRDCLNKAFWGYSSETANSMLIGSWGKQTRVRPSRDVDILFLLPPAVYHRFEQRTGNKQSQLLQEVKTVLTATYSQTAMRGDGQVVVVPFNTTPIEVSPGFRRDDGSIIVCDANGGGRYVVSTAEAEAAAIAASDNQWNGNTRRLACMMKQWQRHCNVPLKSFLIERLAVEFLAQYPFAGLGYFFYDWIIRDFFEYLVGQANTGILMPGTYDYIPLGNEWLSRAKTAHGNALKAYEYERDNNEIMAGLYWQDIFGTHIPTYVS